MRLSHLTLLLTASALAGAGCGRRDSDSMKVNFPFRADTGASVALKEGDVRITTQDGGTDMALIGDTISAGLSQKALADVRRETDTSAVKGTGFGATMEKMVKGTVQSAIGARMAVPLSAVKDVRYEGGRIQFEWNGSAPSGFTQANVNKKNLLESFSAADAKDFVDAVRARKNTKTAK